MPVTVVPTSSATVAIATFITELSSVIKNCPAASVDSTTAAGILAVSFTLNPVSEPTRHDALRNHGGVIE